VNQQKQSMSVGDAVVGFLTGLSPTDREAKQQEVNKFALWYGKNRAISNLTAAEVRTYGEWIASSANDSNQRLSPVKAFLTYAKKKGQLQTSLSTHLTSKRGSSSKTNLYQSRSGEQVTLTPKAFAQAKAELATLQSKRPQIVEELQLAAADKDFRENAPLEAAREMHELLESQIKELEALIRSSVVIEDSSSDLPKVRMGTKVTLCDIDSGEKSTYEIVAPNEVSVAKSKISAASPVGKAIVNRPEGEIVQVVAPKGNLQYRIEQIHT